MDNNQHIFITGLKNRISDIRKHQNKLVVILGYKFKAILISSQSAHSLPPRQIRPHLQILKTFQFIP